jgi:hypothetical protein
MDTWESFPGVKWPGMTLTTHLHPELMFMKDELYLHKKAKNSYTTTSGLQVVHNIELR